MNMDISRERNAVLQAAILASLHWEGREGINSSLDALGIAIRIAQEMGLHRQGATSSTVNGLSLQRRTWWCIFALDRLNAATEGTPFLINELDCDIPRLTASDFAEEDTLVRDTAMLNVELALVVNDAVRWFYSPAVNQKSLYSRIGEDQRDLLSRQLDNLDDRAISTDSSLAVFRIQYAPCLTAKHLRSLTITQ